MKLKDDEVSDVSVSPLEASYDEKIQKHKV